MNARAPEVSVEKVLALQLMSFAERFDLQEVFDHLATGHEVHLE